MQLHYQSFGSGQPLIFIHGLFGSGDNWRGIAKHFAQSYQVFLPDLRNHGRSPQSAQQDYALMAEDLSAFMDDCRLTQAHLVGHSLGGKVAMQFATRYPERLDQLIIVDMAMRHYPDEHTQLMDALMALDLSQLKSRTEADQALSTAIPNAMIRQFLLLNLVRQEDGLSWRINLPALRANYPALQSAISFDSPYEGPTCFIKGAKSHYVNTDDEKVIQEQFLDVTIETLVANHWVHAEAPDAFIQTLENVFAEN